MNIRHLVILLLLFLPLTEIKAQDNLVQSDPLRPVTSTFVFGLGSSEIADTYLSPIIYRGWNGMFNYSRTQAMKFSPERWIMELGVKLDVAKGKNKVQNTSIWHAGVEIDWAMLARWKTSQMITLGIGGYTGLNVGAIYLSSNGNNPVAAKGAWYVGLRALGTLKFKMGKIPVLARWQGSTPIGGIFFSPDYGELYYEIWLGNHRDLVHGAWWGNYFRLDNEVTFDIGFGTNWLRIGYRSGIFSSKVNDITTRLITNSFLLGISGEWISVNNQGKIKDSTRIISALY